MRCTVYISEQYAYFKFLMYDMYEMKENYDYPITSYKKL